MKNMNKQCFPMEDNIQTNYVLLNTEWQPMSFNERQTNKKLLFSMQDQKKMNEQTKETDIFQWETNDKQWFSMQNQYAPRFSTKTKNIISNDESIT